TEIQHVAGVVELTLAELPGNGGQPHALANGQPRQAVAADREHVGELSAGGLETDRLAVREVVADDLQVGFGGIQPSQSGTETHMLLLLADAGDGRQADLADISERKRWGSAADSERDALHLGAGIGGQEPVLTVDSGTGRDVITAGRQRIALAVGAIPAELHLPRLERAEPDF